MELLNWLVSALQLNKNLSAEGKQPTYNQFTNSTVDLKICAVFDIQKGGCESQKISGFLQRMVCLESPKTIHSCMDLHLKDMRYKFGFMIHRWVKSQKPQTPQFPAPNKDISRDPMCVPPPQSVGRDVAGRSPGGSWSKSLQQPLSHASGHGTLNIG